MSDDDELFDNLRCIEKWAYSNDPKAMEKAEFTVGQAVMIEKIYEYLKLSKKGEEDLSPRMTRLKKAGLLGCFDGTGVNSENYKDILREE